MGRATFRIFDPACFLPRSFESCDLSRATLFWWNTFFLALLSSKLNASERFLGVGDFCNFLMASFTFRFVVRLNLSLFISCRNFFFALFITGIFLVVY